MRPSPRWVSAGLRATKMMSTKFNFARQSGWDGAFWFAVLSPIIGVLVAFLALTLSYYL